ncbi:MAG: AEC family transporter [Lachnospiraceae bacterium]|nr:AEC family transporter [Lachnospiraceae bacterium]
MIKGGLDKKLGGLIVLKQMSVIAILVGIGIWLQKRDVLNDKSTPFLSRIVVDICNPALIVSSIVSGNISVTHEDFLNGVGISAAVYFLFIVLGYIVPHIIRVPKDERKFYTMMCIFGNVGFLGIPVARAILPENCMLYVIICNVFYNLIFYTHGIVTLSSGKEKMNLKKLFSPGVLMSVFALVIFWFDLELPDMIENTIQYLGNPTVFLSMILLGAAVGRSRFFEEVSDLKLWMFILIRLVAVPVAVVILLGLLNVQEEMIRTFCLMCAVPVGNLPMIQAEKTGERTDVLSKGIIVTTVFSFFSITILMSFL